MTYQRFTADRAQGVSTASSSSNRTLEEPLEKSPTHLSQRPARRPLRNLPLRPLHSQPRLLPRNSLYRHTRGHIGLRGAHRFRAEPGLEPADADEVHGEADVLHDEALAIEAADERLQALRQRQEDEERDGGVGPVVAEGDAGDEDADPGEDACDAIVSWGSGRRWGGARRTEDRHHVGQVSEDGFGAGSRAHVCEQAEDDGGGERDDGDAGFVCGGRRRGGLCRRARCRRAF